MYRIEWFDSLVDESPVGSYSFVSPHSGCDPCIHTINGLSKGQDYFVRVYAYNSHGYSEEPGLPEPQFLSPKTTPNPPEIVNISPQSDTEILVTFPRSSDDGGAPVTKYKIQWNTMGYKLGMPSMNDDHRALLYSPYNVQSITLSADEDDLGGVYRIAFDGHSTEEISAKSTANDMKLALESLPTLGSIVVSRESTSNGFRFTVTFLTNTENISTYGPIPSLTCTEATLLGTNAKILIQKEVTKFKGYEQQTLTSQCNTPTGILSGHFAISFEGAMTSNIPHDASPELVKSELESIAQIGTVQVSRRKILDRINSFQWTVIFLERLGNVPLLSVHDYLTCSDGSGGPLVYVTETAQGVLPRMDGSYAGEVELPATEYQEYTHTVDNLMRGIHYFFQVSAWNGAGETYGAPQHSTPPLMIPMDKPDPPTSVEMSSIDNSTLSINWDTSLCILSHEIVKFQVQLAESNDAHFENAESFDVVNRPEVQKITLESTAEDMGGYITVWFMGESSPSIYIDSNAEDIKQGLEGISTIESVDVSISDSLSKSWTITFTTQTVSTNMSICLSFLYECV